MKKQLRDLVVKFVKQTDVEKITKSLCKEHLISKVMNNCGDISRYDNHINEVMNAELDKKMGKQLVAMKKVVKNGIKRRIRTILSTYLKDYDIFNPSAIVLPDELTASDREDHDEFISLVINQEIHAKARKKLREAVTVHMSTLTDTDLTKLDYGLVKAYVVKCFHDTQSAKNMVEDEGAYMRNVIHNVNVKKIQKVIDSLLLEYMSNNDLNMISTNTCMQHVSDFFSHHTDGGEHVRKKHHQYIKDTIQKIINKTFVDEEPSSDSEVPESEDSSSDDDSD